jgi:hypothetical protein
MRDALDLARVRRQQAFQRNQIVALDDEIPVQRRLFAQLSEEIARLQMAVDGMSAFVRPRWILLRRLRVSVGQVTAFKTEAATGVGKPAVCARRAVQRKTV